jgi:hypothetical protein
MKKSTRHIIGLPGDKTEYIVAAKVPISKAAATRCFDRWASEHHPMPYLLIKKQIEIEYESWRDERF